ncbi:MAG: Fur family transcriptional regulator [Planctomycetota bacterium]|jgi:Fur family ferric uptake transcriptional regulator
MTERRNTLQQDAIRDAFEAAGRPLSIDEVHESSAESAPTLGLRTVYRAVRRLEEDGVIARVMIPGQPDRYELAKIAAKHHHHFHCVGCDRVFDVDGCAGRLERLLPKGFVLDAHELTLSGWCNECA